MTLDDAIATFTPEIHSETMFSRDNMSKAGQWLVDEAARHFPKAFQ